MKFDLPVVDVVDLVDTHAHQLLQLRDNAHDVVGIESGLHPCDLVVY